jgi:hypothetical protein
MFDVDFEYMGPVLRAFLVNQPGGLKYFHSVKDSQSFLDDLITLGEEKQCWPKYSNKNILLWEAKFARNKLCHAELVPLFEKYDEFLISWIKVYDMLGQVEASALIQVIRNYLKSLSTLHAGLTKT